MDQPTREAPVPVGACSSLRARISSRPFYLFHTRYDGKYILAVFSGGQQYESGIFILDATTDEPYGYLPSPGGHHDCVIVPRNLDDLKNSRSTTV